MAVKPPMGKPAEKGKKRKRKRNKRDDSQGFGNSRNPGQNNDS